MCLISNIFKSHEKKSEHKIFTQSNNIKFKFSFKKLKSNGHNSSGNSKFNRMKEKIFLWNNEYMQNNNALMLIILIYGIR